jgi:hypothetical protein
MGCVRMAMLCAVRFKIRHRKEGKGKQDAEQAKKEKKEIDEDFTVHL